MEQFTPRPEIGNGYYSKGNVLYYHGDNFSSNDWRVVMKDVCERLGWKWSTDQIVAYDAYLTNFVANYRKQMENYVPSAEEQYEMRAAFGSNTKVVNVLTGKTYNI